MPSDKRRRCLTAFLLVALGAAGCTTDERAWPYAFQNETSVTVSVALQAPDGHEVVLAPSIAPGGSWQGGSTDCRVDGTYVARDAAGREVAVRKKYCGDPWVIDGRIEVMLFSALARPATFVFSPASGPDVVVARDVVPHASVSVDIAALGDPAVLCTGRLSAYEGRQAAVVADHAVAKCADWNWTFWEPSASP